MQLYSNRSRRDLNWSRSHGVFMTSKRLKIIGDSDHSSKGHCRKFHINMISYSRYYGIHTTRYSFSLFSFTFVFSFLFHSLLFFFCLFRLMVVFISFTCNIGTINAFNKFLNLSSELDHSSTRKAKQSKYSYQHRTRTTLPEESLFINQSK